VTKLPQVTGERVVRALLRAGFVEVRQSGSHVALRHGQDPQRRATVPVHGSKPVRPGTLRAILDSTGLTVEQLMELL
jgi:predicted RNA binding protein YcfA (HicA-like mRNA interferase family)